MNNRETRRSDELQNEDTGGEHTKAQKPPGTDSGSADDTGDPSEEEVVAVSIDLDQSSDSITDEARPQAETTVDTGIVRPASISLDQLTEQSIVVDPVVPGTTVSRSGGVTVTTSVELRPAQESVKRPVQPDLRSKNSDGVVAQHDIKLKQQEESVVEPAKLSARETGEQTGSQALLDELEEYDPVFGWYGGSPYGSDRPLFVVNCDPASYSTLGHLQGVLRDTYAELKGGEPGTAAVEFLANEFRAPPVQGKVVTLDLRDDGWDATIQNGEPTIERSDRDLVPRLIEVVETLYSGDLGYFVLNVPTEWADSYLMEGFHARLVGRLAGVSDMGEAAEYTAKHPDSETLFEAVESAPVVLTEPQVETQKGFVHRVTNYHGLGDETPEEFESVRQVERAVDRVLTQNDWIRVTLTERHNEESNRHYLWKAAIVDGVCRALWREVENGGDDRGYQSFVRETLLKRIDGGDFTLETEHEIVSKENADRVPTADIWISSSGADNTWTTAVRNLFGVGKEGEDDEEENVPVEFPVAVEYETGFSEGAFNFRKVVETLEKYENESEAKHVAVVIPPRLLYRGQSRARLLVSLVSEWTEQEERASATLYVPELVSGVVRRLVPAADRIERLYE